MGYTCGGAAGKGAGAECAGTRGLKKGRNRDVMAETKNALSFRGVNFSYGTDPVLRDVTFSVPQGEFLIIIGPNGGGKTTLLKLALGLLVPESGTISVFGKKPGEDRSVAGYVPQDTGRNRDFPITALEVALQGRLGFPGGRLSYGRKDREAAMEALKALKMESLAGRSMGELSQGQRQRVLIARGLASDPGVLFLDEPLASIDPETRDMLLTLLGELCGRLSVVMVSHDMSAVSAHATAVACVNRKVFYHDSAEIGPDAMEQVWGRCPVELVAHGIPHRVLAVHDHDHGGEGCSHD